MFGSEGPVFQRWSCSNDALTLRKAAARSDAYAVFRKMLLRGSPPEDFDVLMRQAKED